MATYKEYLLKSGQRFDKKEYPKTFKGKWATYKGGANVAPNVIK